MTPLEIYERLYARYGNLRWWPAESIYEVMLGAVLTQNTAWGNVEKAISNLNTAAEHTQEVLTPEWIERIDTEQLMGFIRPAGFFKQKTAYIKALTAWYGRYGYSAEAVKRRDKDALRQELLAVRGVGRETADAILLYAFGVTGFVVDAYTLRLLSRLPVQVGRGDYESVRAYFENHLPADVYLYNNFHACIVINAKEHCRAKPLCAGCPLAEGCACVIPPPRSAPAGPC